MRPHNHPVWHLLLPPPFYGPGNRGRGESSNLSKALQPVSADLAPMPFAPDPGVRAPLPQVQSDEQTPLGGSAGALPQLLQEKGGTGARAQSRGWGAGPGSPEHFTHRTMSAAKTLHVFLCNLVPFLSCSMARLRPVPRGADMARADTLSLSPSQREAPSPTKEQGVGCGFFIDAPFENTLET